MKRYYITEDKLPRKLLVKFSATIYKQINSIAYFNRNNIEALSQWAKNIFIKSINCMGQYKMIYIMAKWSKIYQ